MRDLKIIRNLIIIFFGVVFIISMSGTVVHAADSNDSSDLFDEVSDDEFNDISNNTNVNNTNTGDTNNSNSSLSNTINNTLNNTSNNNTSNNTNKSVTNTNTLAETGLSDFNGGVALIILVSVISAIYSFKKVNDYKKL